MPFLPKADKPYQDEELYENARPWSDTPFLTKENPPHTNMPATLGHTIQKVPYQESFQETPLPDERESIFHPVKAIDDLLTAVDKNTQAVNALYKLMILERTFTDEPVGLGATVGYTVSYQERKYLYALAWSAITLQTPMGTLALTAGKWVNVSWPRGTVITIQGGNDQSLQVVTFRHCDMIMN